MVRVLRPARRAHTEPEPDACARAHVERHQTSHHGLRLARKPHSPLRLRAGRHSRSRVRSALVAYGARAYEGYRSGRAGQGAACSRVRRERMWPAALIPDGPHEAVSYTRPCDAPPTPGRECPASRCTVVVQERIQLGSGRKLGAWRRDASVERRMGTYHAFLERETITQADGGFVRGHERRDTIVITPNVNYKKHIVQSVGVVCKRPYLTPDVLRIVQGIKHLQGYVYKTI